MLKETACNKQYLYTGFALQGISARGQCSNSRGWDNARAEGEYIICPIPLLLTRNSPWYASSI